MAGCYGNSAEDRYFESMLDNYLDSLETIEDVYGDKADEIIDNRITTRSQEYIDWIENEWLYDSVELSEDSSKKILDIIINDNKIQKKYHDAVYETLLNQLASEERSKYEIFEE